MMDGTVDCGADYINLSLVVMQCNQRYVRLRHYFLYPLTKKFRSNSNNTIIHSLKTKVQLKTIPTLLSQDDSNSIPWHANTSSYHFL